MKTSSVPLRLTAWSGVAVIAGTLCVRCGDGSIGSNGPSGEGGADAGASDANADADVWDPVWHKTEPAQWPTVGAEGQPDCGPGCRIAINMPISHPGYFSYGYDSKSIGDTTYFSIYHAIIGSSVTQVLTLYSDGKTVVLQPSVYGDFMTYLASVTYTPQGRVELIHLTTGEVKTLYSYENGDGTSWTALNDKYAFWLQDSAGLVARDLLTGEVHVLGHGLSCEYRCTTPTGLICGNEGGRVLKIDQDTWKETALDNGGAMQVNANCSPDSRRVVWIDYRDPPGPNATYDFHRTGGEIYMKDLETNETKRLTFDSPDQPRGKYGSVIGDDVVVWREPCSTCNPNPTSVDSLIANSTLVRLDLGTGKKCRTHRDQTDYHSLHGHHVYGYWLDSTKNERRVIDINLDDPAIEWSCE